MMIEYDANERSMEYGCGRKEKVLMIIKESKRRMDIRFFHERGSDSGYLSEPTTNWRSAMHVTSE